MGFLRAIPTTPRTVSSARASRGTKMRGDGAVQIRRRDLHPRIEQRQKIVGYHSFECFVVAEFEPHPQTFELRAAQESLALRLVLAAEFTNEIDGANVLEGDRAVLAVHGQQIKRLGVSAHAGG